MRSLWLGTPASNDVWMAFVWCAVLLAIFAPLAVASLPAGLGEVGWHTLKVRIRLLGAAVAVVVAAATLVSAAPAQAPAKASAAVISGSLGPRRAGQGVRRRVDQQEHPVQDAEGDRAR